MNRDLNIDDIAAVVQHMAASGFTVNDAINSIQQSMQAFWNSIYEFQNNDDDIPGSPELDEFLSEFVVTRKDGVS